MKLNYFYFECGNCEKEFKSPELLEETYGEFLMRSEKGDVVYLCALDNGVFAEFSDMLKKHSFMLEVKDLDRATILHSIFGWACDLSADGARYEITQKPVCPRCGKCNIKRWGPTNPLEFTEMYIRPVTHEEWNRLSKDEKQTVVDEAINNYLNQKEKPGLTSMTKQLLQGRIKTKNG